MATQQSRKIKFSDLDEEIGTFGIFFQNQGLEKCRQNYSAMEGDRNEF